MTHWKRSVPYILILFYSSHANRPILLAKPYPFNRSESSRIECFTNDQSLILSLTILVTLLDNNFKSSSSFQSTANNITKNGSIVLNIPSPFNYSQLDSPIQCRSKYYHGEQKVRQLDVLSVVEIPEKELLTINTNIKQLIIIHCPIYGTNVSVQWNFGHDHTKALIDPLPIGIHLDQKSIRNDTLIIDHVSYIDHHGYYQCSASNRLLGRTFHDHTIFYLNVKKNTVWSFILIACSIIGICILVLILCTTSRRRMRQS